jgi:sortase A
MQIKNQKKNKKLKKHLLTIVGAFTIIVGISIVGYKYYHNYVSQEIEEQQIEDFYEIQEEIVNEEIEEQEEVKESNVDEVYREPYIAVLKIDKIGLQRGMYDINSKNNNVNKNIQILKGSDMPDVDKGNLIIAGHSGNGYSAYFRNLPKLDKGDIATISFNGKTYSYKLTNSYEIEKTGKAVISKNKDKTTLTLITCKHNTNKQIVFIFELENIF